VNGLDLLDQLHEERLRHRLVDGRLYRRYRELDKASQALVAAGFLSLLPSGRLLPVARGGALGSGAVYMRNLPAPGSYVIDPARFAILTTRNRKANPPIAWAGFGAQHGQRVDAVGVVGRLLVNFTGTLTNDGVAVPTATNQYPWNLIRSLVISANGLNNLFSCDGADLRALWRARTPHNIADRQSAFALSAAIGGAANISLWWEIPLAFDESLIGAVFAQTEETYLNVSITSATAADLFSAHAPAVTAASFRVFSEFFNIPSVDSKAGRVLVLPDVRQLHGVIAQNVNLTGTGDHIAPLVRTGGVLLRALQRIDNGGAGGATQIGQTDFGGGNVTSHRFRYGGNVVPYDWTGDAVKWQNERDYGDMILPTADAITGGQQPQYVVDDFVNASALRDSIHMLGITEPQLVNTIGGGVVVSAGAQMHTVQESMVAG
jgi:hypothetical protein